MDILFDGDRYTSSALKRSEVFLNGLEINWFAMSVRTESWR